MTSSTTSGNRSIRWSTMGGFRSGTRAFGRVSVRGRSRVPTPPAIRTACTRARTMVALRTYLRSLGNDRHDVVPAEHDRADAADLFILRLFRVLEDHVHVLVVTHELAVEDA